MNKIFKVNAILFVLVLSVLALVEFSKNEVTDWRKNFDTSKKTPFGLFVFSQEVSDIFKNKLKKTEETPYQYYQDEKTFRPHNILIVQKLVDTESIKKILNQVSKGSQFMLITNEPLRDLLRDTLKIYSEPIYDSATVMGFTDKKLKNDSLILDKLPDRTKISYIRNNVQILGTIKSGKSYYANFVKVKFGKGNIYYHLNPSFLANYYLLIKGNEKYVQNVFSYLPNQETIWFTENSTVAVSESPMRFILANPPLKYAWWLLLGGLLLFVIFNAKRKQRIVPIIEPVKNKSVEFVQSIGNLYLQEGDFHYMMAKKAQHFLYKVRMDLKIETNILDEVFINKIHLKTGADKDKISQAVEFIKKAQNPYASVIREDLIMMNKLLDEVMR